MSSESSGHNGPVGVATIERALKESDSLGGASHGGGGIVPLHPPKTNDDTIEPLRREVEANVASVTIYLLVSMCTALIGVFLFGYHLSLFNIPVFICFYFSFSEMWKNMIFHTRMDFYIR